MKQFHRQQTPLLLIGVCRSAFDERRNHRLTCVSAELLNEALWGASVFFSLLKAPSLVLLIYSPKPGARAVPIQAHYEAIRRISISIGSPHTPQKAY
ncbi:hypothetical protein Zmor_025333 [Zophobas morio]|uniref:Uncharacterized protein n=1 Tax=Zophobas morio TaxID=2755281 RepID=A0AA38HRK2_9CUCU|nr:hypothetical protein Zmor_025333 [Zophobas morio]